MASLARFSSSKGRPSSVKPIAPASLSSFKSASSSLFIPFVMQAQVLTFIGVFLPFLSTSNISSGLSIGGFVFAMATIVVKPPLAAALAPLAISSLYSKPGSLKCTCTSTNPGAAQSPVQS